jgi:23S rRNA (adenine-C8)-methyltransferase
MYMNKKAEINRIEQIKNLLGDRYPAFTLNQIKDAIYKQGVKSYLDISTIKKELREELKDTFGDVLSLKPIAVSKEKQAQKILFETKDGHRIESVQMIYEPNEERKVKHNALCISTQSGCAMGCKFCATGATGFRRDLTQDEIADQLLYFIQEKIDIDTVFFSGMGEPLANPNFFNSLDIFINYMGLSQRKLSVSTCGIIPGIKSLTEKYPQVNIALSLHSPFQKQREDLMPATKKYPLPEVLIALREHLYKTNKKVFLAYVMLSEVNDSEEHAKELCRIVKRSGKKDYLFHVNLIKFHEGPTLSFFKQSTKEDFDKFTKILESRHINYTVRQNFGSDIEAACGQLYAKYIPE